MVTYSPTLPTNLTKVNLYSNSQCVFCGKHDIIKRMYIASLDSGVEEYPATGTRVFPINPSSYVFLCQWCAHFDSKAERDIYTDWKLNDMIQQCIEWLIPASNYNGIL